MLLVPVHRRSVNQAVSILHYGRVEVVWVKDEVSTKANSWHLLTVVQRDSSSHLLEKATCTFLHFNKW